MIKFGTGGWRAIITEKPAFPLNTGSAQLSIKD